MEKVYSQKYHSDETWMYVYVISLSLAGYFMLKMLLSYLSLTHSYIVASMLAVISYHLSYRTIHKSVSIMIRGLLALVVLYLYFSHPYFIVDGEQGASNHYLANRVEVYFWVTMVLGMLAFWKPAFAWFPPVYMLKLKIILGSTSGISLTPTDYRIIIETIMFTLLVLVVMKTSVFLVRQLPSLRNYKLSFIADCNEKTSAEFIFFSIIAIHFSNYFYAGIAKVTLDGPFLSWLQNDTSNIFYGSLLLKMVPVMGFDSAVKWTGHLLSEYYIVSNILVLGFQLFCLFALRSKKLTFYFTLFYDLMHLVIFFSTGIFFYKWMLFNTVLLFALSRVETEKVPKIVWITSMCIVVLAPLVFFIPWLGWYDTRSINVPYFEAVLDDGEVVEVPTNYFRNYSVTFAQTRLQRNIAPHFPTGAIGNVTDYQNYLKANECKLGIVSPRSKEKYQRVMKDLKSFIRGYHQFVLGRVDSDGIFHFNRFPHHIWSNINSYKKAANLDWRRVREYRLVLEARCITGTDKLPQVTSTLAHRTVINFSI